MKKPREYPVAQQNAEWARQYKGELVEVECYRSIPDCGGVPHDHRALVPPAVAKRYGPKKIKVLGPYKRPGGEKPEKPQGRPEGNRPDASEKQKAEDAKLLKELEPVLELVKDKESAKVLLDKKAVAERHVLALARSYDLPTEGEGIREAVYNYIVEKRLAQ